MQEQNTIYIGIDVSKLTFDVAFKLPGQERGRHRKLRNDAAGFATLVSFLSEHSIMAPHVVMEASGPYYLRLATFLHQQGVAVSVVNPLVIRRFCQMRLTRAKTDKKDAQLIAAYGDTEHPEQWQPERSEGSEGSELRQLQSTLDLLEKQRRMLKNHQEAQLQYPELSSDSAGATRRMLEQVEKEIAKLLKQMSVVAKEGYGPAMQLVQSIPGIGKKTAIMLLMLTGGFERFGSAKQVSSYFGLCPRLYESGTSVRGKGRINEAGHEPDTGATIHVCVECGQV